MDNSAQPNHPSVPSSFLSLSDEKIAELAQQGDNTAMEYLFTVYKNFVRTKARAYFLVGADHEDIVQEGMIGLFKSIRDYRPDRNASFKVFAELCITRQIITAIKSATRQKHGPLNSYISLSKPIYNEDNECTLLDIIVEGDVPSPEDVIINRENLIMIQSHAKEVLSDFEQDVLRYYLAGKSYQQIADKLTRHAKSVDNALQRVKRKLEKYIQDTEREDAP